MTYRMILSSNGRKYILVINEVENETEFVKMLHFFGLAD